MGREREARRGRWWLLDCVLGTTQPVVSSEHLSTEGFALLRAPRKPRTEEEDKGNRGNPRKWSLFEE